MLKGRECIYVLELENNKWYVGYTKNISQRLKAHFAFNCKSSEWNKKHKPIRVEMIIKDADISYEDFVTYFYMIEKGWENVRGGKYVCVKMGKPPIVIDPSRNPIPTSEIPTGKYVIYVLELEHGKYYVGATTNQTRNTDVYLNKFKKNPNAWTKLHKPIKVVEVLRGYPKIVTKQVTLDYMRFLGWENIRGWGWSQCNMKNPPKEL